MSKTGATTNSKTGINQDLLEIIYTTTDDIIWDWDISNNSIAVNNNWNKTFGYKSLQLDKQTFWYNVIHPADRVLVKKSLDEVLEKGGKFHEKYFILLEDGTYQSVINRGHVIFANGTATRMVGTMMLYDAGDATENKLAESEERLREALLVAAAGTWKIDIKTGLDIRDASLNKILGLEAKDTVIPIDDSLIRIHPDDKHKIQNALQKAIEEKGSYDEECRIFRPDGTMRWLRDRGRVIVDAEGNADYIIGSAIDITELKQTQEALNYQNRLVKAITDGATSSLLMLDKNGYCTFINPAGEKMFGYTFDEIRQKPLHYMIHHHKADGTVYPIEECPLDTAVPGNTEIKYQTDTFFRKDGTAFPVACSASPIYENGTPVSTVLEVRDITQQLMAEEALKRSSEELERLVAERTKELKQANEHLERSNSELEQFAYVTSHDLQEPLRKIKIYAKRLKDEGSQADKEKQESYLQKLILSTERMTILIHDLLNYSRLNDHKKEFVPVDLNEIVKDVINDFEVLIQQKDASIEVGVLPVITGIPLQLTQLFVNLISNSLKFSKVDRKPEIIINSEQLKPDEAASLGLIKCDHYKITVTDNGIGFKPSFKEQIFEIFQRLHSKDQIAGTGIGLALTRRVVENHSGKIEAEAEEGNGAKFTIYLPASRQDCN